MNKQNNKYIAQAQKKRRKKRLIAFILLLIIGFLIFALKSQYFVVSKVAILGNPVISGEDIKEKTQYLIGKKIFFIDKGDIRNVVKQNPYVDSIEITRKYPRQINIKVSEKQGVYYTEENGIYSVMDSSLTIIEKTDNIDNRNLVRLYGLNFEATEPGETAVSNTRTKNLLKTFNDIIQVNPTNFKLDSIDLTNLADIRVYIGEIEGRFGSDEDIIDKANKFLHVITNEQIGIKKGYIDVGFDGAPVYYSE